MNTSASGKGIALVLSGGGIRAMAFHAGVLKYLAEHALLERVQRISTVSGGSLLTGLIFQFNRMAWPTSQGFLNSTYPTLQSRLCDRSLQWGALRQLRDPRNWRFLLSRANLLGLALRNEWQVDACLKDLPQVPEWSINGTTAENGKRFRFKAANMGDYELGYAADCGAYPLAQALAVSAAFPGGFGPLTIETSKFTWLKKPWGAAEGTEIPVQLPFQRLHLYDGGVYDNLGLEPFFDAGKGRCKVGDLCIVVSDAGAPLAPGFSFGQLSVFRLKRVADIMSDQAHALRVRTFATYLQGESGRGALMYIGTPMTRPQQKADQECATAFPTTLRRLTPGEFDLLARHGHSVADVVAQQYGLLEG